MDICLSLNTVGFDCIYLINGRMLEGGEITYSHNEVVYIVVMPLDAALLPYTVKLVGGTVKNNLEQCDCFKLEEHKYFLRLKPRYNYVYSVNTTAVSKPKGLVPSFFFFLMGKKINDARACLTTELSESVDNNSLSSFFDGFKDIIDGKNENTYYLITDAGEGKLFSFVIKNNLIDNIIEL